MHVTTGSLSDLPEHPHEESTLARRTAMKNALTCALVSIAMSVATQGASLPNGSFEQGADGPTAWELSGGTGGLAKEGAEGARCVSVTGTGKDSNYWSTPAPKLEAGKTYRFSFAYRTPADAKKGCVISGSSFANRDFGGSAEWTRKSFVFAVPKGASQSYFRLGQWHRADTVLFDDARLAEVTAVHQRQGDVALGEGESISSRTYRFVAPLRGEGSNHARPLLEHTAGFNSNRWVFAAGQYVLYRHEVAGASHVRGRLKVNVGYYVSGELVIEAGKSLDDLKEVGRIGDKTAKEFDLPKDVFPATAVYIRLSASGGTTRDKDSAPGSFQVHSYSLESALDGDVPDFVGETHYVDVGRRAQWLDVKIESLGRGLPGPDNEILASLRSKSDRDVSAEVGVTVTDEKSGAAQRFASRVRIPARGQARATVRYAIPDAGAFDVALRVSEAGQALYEARTTVTIPRLYSTSYGYFGGRDPSCEWWWCESTYKVSRERPSPPTETARPVVEIAGARGEYEAAQIVLRPRRALRGVRLDLHTPGAAWAKGASALLVHYLYVSRPTDSSSCIGWWPDALPPYERPFDLSADQNQPIWVRVKIPRDAKPGTHELRLDVSAQNGPPRRIPVRVRVYDFAMPEKPHVESGFGLSIGGIRRYHNLKKTEDVAKVWDLYMQNFREHRMAPYDFAPLDPIKVKFGGFHWQGGDVVSDAPAGGKGCLKVVDDSDSQSVSCAQAERMRIERGRAYEFSWRARTEKDGQKYLVTLQTYDKDGRWIPYHNIDLLRKGSKGWQHESLRLVITKRSPRAASATVSAVFRHGRGHRHGLVRCRVPRG